MKNRYLYVCPDCKSFDIEEIAWIKTNFNRSYVEEFPEDERFYCCACNTRTDKLDHIMLHFRRKLISYEIKKKT